MSYISKEFEEVLEKIFEDEDEKQYNTLQIITDNDPVYDDILSSYNVNSDIVDNVNSYNDLCDQIINKDNISLEESFFVKLWNTILMIIKKLGNAISNFLKMIIVFFKRVFSRKSIISDQLKDVKITKDDVDSVYDKIDHLFSTESSTGIEDSSLILSRPPIHLINPGKEEQYLKVLSDAFRGSFIGEFRKVSFALNSISDFPLSDRNEDSFIDKIDDVESKCKEYKEKIRNILIDLELSKNGNIITLSRSNGKEVINNAVERSKSNKDHSKDVVSLFNPSNCNRMINDLTLSVKRIQTKSANVSESIQHAFKRIGTFTSATIAMTNRFFSAAFDYIKGFMMSENINLKLAEMALAAVKRNENK